MCVKFRLYKKRDITVYDNALLYEDLHFLFPLHVYFFKW